AVKTDIGLRRKENQDAYGIAHTAGISFFVVADGMGGARGGATASAIAIQVIVNEAIKQNGIITRPSLKKAVETANDAIYSRSKSDENLQGMGTTVVALAFVNECAIVAHVGDSRIYRLSAGELKQLTRDHTLVQELVDSGALPPEEAENHPIAHMLTRSLGPAAQVEVEIQALAEPTQAGDKFLLCSDGLYNLVTDEEITQHLIDFTPEDANEKLVALALERGGTDNVTVEILEVCDAEDESLSVEYPTDGEMQFIYSEGVAAEDIVGILEQKKSSVDVEDLEDTQRMPIVSDDEAAALADVVDDDFSDSQDSLGQPAVVSSGAQIRLQASVFFVVGLTAAIFGFFLYQYSGVKSSPLHLKRIATTPAVQPDGQLALELTTLQDPDKQATTGPDLSTTLPSQIPSMQGAVQTDAQELSKTQKFLAELLLPDAPAIQVRDPEVAQEKATRPIVWENEESKFQRMLDNQRALNSSNAGQEESDIALLNPDSSASLLTAEEKRELLRKKRLLRDRISDIDSKLKVLGINSASTAKEVAKLINQKAQEKSSSIVRLRSEIDKIANDAVIWHSRLDLARGRSAVRLAEEIVEEDKSLQPVFRSYSRACERYSVALAQWQSDPNDAEFAAQMGSGARECEQARVALEQSLAVFVMDRIAKLDSDISESRLSEDFLTIDRDQLSRFEGYLKGYTKLSAVRKKELRDGYYRERGKFAETLNDIRDKLSDSREVKLLLEQYRPDFSK
ncbi:UNVERIFIED_CONTAM: hypothetical protein GTU68_048588, partial [Idotea baltica]|nr:hypothetical protein [Idotea baltica]